MIAFYVANYEEEKLAVSTVIVPVLRAIVWTKF